MKIKGFLKQLLLPIRLRTDSVVYPDCCVNTRIWHDATATIFSPVLLDELELLIPHRWSLS